MQRATEIQKENKKKMLLWGPPKNGGKTTFAVSGPGNKLVLQYDIGSVTIPPGVDPNTVWVQEYNIVPEKFDINSDKWKCDKSVAGAAMKDLDEIHMAFLENRDIKLIDFKTGKETTCPLPDTLILDGAVPLHDAIVQWICAVNNITDFEGSDTYKYWGKRTKVMMATLRKALKLPCNVFITTWESSEYIKDSKGVIIGVKAKWPDVGGQMDFRTAGLVDGALYCYSEKTLQGVRYMVRTKSDGFIQGVGIRGIYTLDEVIDVTIDAKNKTLPYYRVWKDELKKAA